MSDAYEDLYSYSNKIRYDLSFNKGYREALSDVWEALQETNYDVWGISAWTERTVEGVIDSLCDGVLKEID